MYWVWNDRRNNRYDPFFKSDTLLIFKWIPYNLITRFLRIRIRTMF